MGDFYELFFEDAEVASRALGIVLTKRGKHLGRDIPMCGVPIHRSDEYLHRLIALGHRVAVCEQLEDPAEAKKRGSKSVVRRDVVRLVTPGTLTEDTLLDARRNNYLLAVVRARVSSAGEEARFGIAWIDISTGEFRIAECDRAGLAAEIARLEPGEIIVSDALYSDPELASYLRTLPAVTPLTRDVFDGATAERRLSDYFAVATTDAFGAMSRLELNAAAACITYVERTQLGKRPPLSPPVREASGSTLSIDQATRSNLELVRTLGGERRGSLLAAIDRTVTPAGSRLLAQRLAAPLTDPAQIVKRLDAVETFVGDAATRQEIRTLLNAAPDLARSLSRLVVGRGGPRDLAAIRDGIAAASQIAALLGRLKDAPTEIAEAAKALRQPDPALAQELGAALADELPLFKRDGGFVRAGYLHGARRGYGAARRIPQGDRATASRLRRRNRCACAENPAQQRARLFRRGDGAARRQADDRAAQRTLHPPPDTGRPGPLHHHRTRRAGGEDRQRRRPRAGAGAGDVRQAVRHRDRGKRRHQGRRRGAGACSTSQARSPRWRSSATTCGPRSINRWSSSSKAAGIRWWSSLSASRSSPTTAT